MRAYVDQNSRNFRQRLAEKSGWLTLVLIVVGAILIFNYKVFRLGEPELCDGGETFVACQTRLFKDGSLGGEISTSIPLRIFQVLPEVFDGAAPEDAQVYDRFGFLYEKGRDLPLGFARRVMGYERVTLNCALCHVASYRFAAADERRLVIGGPATSVDIQAYLDFLRDIVTGKNDANKVRWDDDKVLGAIERRGKLSWYDRLLYRFYLIPETRRTLERQAARFSWLHGGEPPDWGPGRSDSINRLKVEVLGRKYDGSIAHVDFPAIWNLGQRRGQAIYWGGEMRAVAGAVIDHALALGAPSGPETEQRLAQIRDFLETQRPPALFQAMADSGIEPDINEELIKHGKKIFDDTCRSCHGFGGDHVGEVIGVQELGTDPERFDSWTLKDAEDLNQAIVGLGVLREPMTKEKGYVALPLDGLWLRAPYLHNGSVPNLEELLTPPARRKPKFYRGCDIYDVERMGFVADKQPASCPGARLFDTRRPGNANTGHAYGTDLFASEKDALIAYLQTL